MPPCFKYALLLPLVLLSSPALAAELDPIAMPRVDERLGQAPPSISPADQAYLTHTVRRCMEHALRDQSRYEPPYVPDALREVSCRAAVTLRRRGRLLGTSESESLPVMDACRRAADLALAAAKRKEEVTGDALASLTIEIELIGPRERIGHGNDQPAELAKRFEPAIHGIAVLVDDKEILVRPSQLISMETFCDNDEELDHHCDRYQIALENLWEKLGLRGEPPEHKPESIIVLRFRTTHWVESQPRSEPVELIAGMRWISPAGITDGTIQTAIDDLARYIRYRQNTDGIFSYEFLPGRDMYWPKDQNWVRQAATTWSLAMHALHRNDSASREALKRAIEAFRKMATPVRGVDHASFIATPDGTHPLGTTALICLALLDMPDADRNADLLAELMNGIASMQRDDGSFRTHFPPSPSSASQDYFPGEALLAVSRYYASVRDPKWRAICDRSLPHYIGYFRKNRPLMFIPWQTEAWGQLARATRLRKYADFVYELSDVIAGTQIASRELPLAIYDGAFDVSGTGRAGVSTAVYVEGLVEAARTAAVFGDRDQAERYRKAIRNARRFIVQLRFRPEECYYVQSPKDVVGGVRNAPLDPTLRIDHAQHAMAALIGSVEVATTQPVESKAQAK